MYFCGSHKNVGVSLVCREYDLADYGGDIQAFMDACYQAYKDFWQSSPTFQRKKLQRNKGEVNGKEKDFWGIVEGHNDDEISIERYKKVPLLNHVVDEDNILAQEDVLFFKRLHKRKVRVEVFSRSFKYMVVLQEVGNHDRIQFITAHPMTEKTLKKKSKKYEEFRGNGGNPL